MGRTEAGFRDLLEQSGLPFEFKPRLPWLTKVGHLNAALASRLPANPLGAIRTIFVELRGQEPLLASKGAGRDPERGFLLHGNGLLVEVDELQHFTTERLRSFAFLPFVDVLRQR